MCKSKNWKKYSSSYKLWTQLNEQTFVLNSKYQIIVVQSLHHVWLFAASWTAASQAFLYFTISWNLLKLMSIESVMPSNHLILCHPYLLLPSIFPSTRVFSNELALHIRWPKYWNFSFSISPSNAFLPGEFHGQRSLVGYSPWGHKE